MMLLTNEELAKFCSSYPLEASGKSDRLTFARAVEAAVLKRVKETVRAVAATRGPISHETAALIIDALEGKWQP